MSRSGLDLSGKWVCSRCGLSTGRIDGAEIPLPDSWADTADGRFCLSCRRERAANTALEEASPDTPRDARLRLRRSAMIEFEIRRTPDHSNATIARACHSSISAVAQVRDRLGLPYPPSLGQASAQPPRPNGR
jgi:hypothetical protein